MYAIMFIKMNGETYEVLIFTSTMQHFDWKQLEFKRNEIAATLFKLNMLSKKLTNNVFSTLNLTVPRRSTPHKPHPLPILTCTRTIAQCRAFQYNANTHKKNSGLQPQEY